MESPKLHVSIRKSQRASRQPIAAVEWRADLRGSFFLYICLERREKRDGNRKRRVKKRRKHKK